MARAQHWLPSPTQYFWLLLVTGLLIPVQAADYLAGMPPPQPAPSGGGNVLYYLELVINGRDSG
ncbi:hypothetical protein, partial [Pseudomonas aeruginosa]|uniref:hypothetical protein n=1 Tax=Pseudomonas aeruginosa TaxID=287 RepID=UPI0033651C67